MGVLLCPGADKPFLWQGEKNEELFKVYAARPVSGGEEASLLTGVTAHSGSMEDRPGRWSGQV